MNQFNPELQSSANNESKIVFDDGKYRILQCDGKSCYQYYTPTCVRDRVWRLWWNDRDATLYFIVDENTPSSNSIVTPIIVGENSKVTTFNACNETSLIEIIEIYPNLSKILYENFDSNSTYDVLMKIKMGLRDSNGYKYDKFSLREVDDSFNDITLNEKNPGKSMIKLHFNYEEYLRLFYPVNDNEWGDNVQYIISLKRGYMDNPFNDYSQVETDFNDGYLVGSFNQESFQKLVEIGKFLFPKEFEGNVTFPNDSDKLSMLCEKISTIFSREVSNIIEEYQMLDDRARVEGVLEHVDENFCNEFDRFGIFPTDCFLNYVTTVNILESLFVQYNMKGFTINDLLRRIVEVNNLEGDNYQENYYDYYGTFDSESFNKEVSRRLDDILEKIEGDDTFFTNLTEYRKLLDAVSKFGFQKWNIVPSGDKKRFFIKDIDNETNKVKLIVRSDVTGKNENREYDLEGFNNFLYNRELFP